MLPFVAEMCVSRLSSLVIVITACFRGNVALEFLVQAYGCFRALSCYTKVLHLKYMGSARWPSIKSEQAVSFDTILVSKSPESWQH